MSGTRNIKFDAASDLVSGISFQMKASNRKRREEEDKQSSAKINEDHGFFEPSDEFEEKIVQDLDKKIEHKKTEYPYVELQVQDAETIEIETKKE